MRKLIAVVLILTLAFVALPGCFSRGNNNNNNNNNNQNTGPGEAVKLGLGQSSTIASSKDYSKDSAGKETLAVGQVDTVIAAVTFDQAGKVVKVIIDTAQTKVNFDNKMKVTSDKMAAGKTKKELGDAYAMKGASSIGKNWHEQIAELEKWMVGKTVAEIKGMKVKQRDATHPAVPDVPELTSLVTITVQEYLAAVEEAYNRAVPVQGATKLGLGIKTSIDKSKDYGKDAAGKETLPVAQVDTVMTATAFDTAGKVVGTLIDTAQTKINFDKNGKVTSDKTAALKTKVELKEEYGMGKASPIGKEWYQQIAELEKWMVGKTVTEIKAMKLKDEAPDVPELTSKVTIGVTDYFAVVDEAYTTAK